MRKGRNSRFKNWAFHNLPSYFHVVQFHQLFSSTVHYCCASQHSKRPVGFSQLKLFPGRKISTLQPQGYFSMEMSSTPTKSLKIGSKKEEYSYNF